MENTFVELLVPYGALGVVAAYFMVKDWILSSKLEDALNDFTVALNTLINRGV